MTGLAIVVPRIHLAGQARPGLRLAGYGGLGYFVVGSTKGAIVEPLVCASAAEAAVVKTAPAMPAPRWVTSLREAGCLL
jgi:hypothetical protein